MSESIEQIVFDDIEMALQVAEDPTITAAIASVSPVAAALMKFLPVIVPAVKGVETIAFSTASPGPRPVGQSPVSPSAVAAVADHLTPGRPIAAELM